MNAVARTTIASAIALAGLAGLAAGAQAQQFDQPWSFSQQNRAQLAVTMKQLKDGIGQSAGSSSTGTAGFTTIICGGGAATATANNTCIVLNNATGQIETGQDAEGSQDAASSTETTVSGTSEVDEVIEVLNGN